MALEAAAREDAGLPLLGVGWPCSALVSFATALAFAAPGHLVLPVVTQLAVAVEPHRDTPHRDPTTLSLVPSAVTAQQPLIAATIAATALAVPS